MRYANTMIFFLPFIALFMLSASIKADSYGYTTFQMQWKNSSLIASGTVFTIGSEDNNSSAPKKYKMRANTVYKGNIQDKDIVFFCTSTLLRPANNSHPSLSENYLILENGKDYLIFFHSSTAIADGNSLFGGAALQIKEENRIVIENAIRYFREFDQTAPDQIKAFLLKEAQRYNDYSGWACDSNIVQNRYTEAIPIFLDRLKRSDGVDHTQIIIYLIDLGYDRKNLVPHVVKLLNDSEFEDGLQPDTSSLFKKLGSDFAPVIRKFVSSKNEILAVIIRRALLEYGEPDAKQLLFDMAKNALAPTARNLAISTFRQYKGNFTAEEIALIKGFASSKDPATIDEAEYLLRFRIRQY
jgi:hypothetical protein